MFSVNVKILYKDVFRKHKNYKNKIFAIQLKSCRHQACLDIFDLFFRFSYRLMAEIVIVQQKANYSHSYKFKRKKNSNFNGNGRIILNLSIKMNNFEAE